MSTPQVGQGAFAVVPTFKGFRKAVTAETDAAAKSSDRGFRRVFAKTGAESGKQSGQGFKKAFEGESRGFADRATKDLERAVAKSAAAVSSARLKEQDAAGKVRVAERQLAEAREKYSAESSQVVRAEERLETAARQLKVAQDNATSSTKDLRDAQGKLAAAADRAGDELEQSGRRGAGCFSAGFTEIFKGSFLGSAIGNLASSLTSQIGYAIGNGIRQGISFAIGTIDIASDLSESVNAVEVSYGDIAGEIFKLGETSAQTFGLSKRDLNSYAVQFSAFSKGIAGEGGDVSGTFESILGRATDFASVMNLDVSEALGLFQSGLAGETEPLRRYGIDLSAAAVEAYALANGIGDGTGELTEAQKQQARYGALLAQTSAVQGDFANTSDELANKNRINAASWDDIQAKIGTAFLPIASQLATVLGDEVLPTLSKLAEEHGPALGAAFAQALPSLREAATEVLPLLPGLFESLAEGLPAVITLVSTLAPPVIAGAQAFTNLHATASALFGLLTGSSTLPEFRAQIEGLTGPIGDSLRAWMSFTDGVKNALGQLPATIANAFAGARSWLVNSGKAVIQGFLDGINAMFAPVGNAVSGLMGWVRGFFPNSPAERGPFAGAGWSRLKDSGSAVVEQWTSGFARPDLTGALTPALSAASVGGAGSGAPGARTVQHVTEVIQLVADGRVLSETVRKFDRSVG